MRAKSKYSSKKDSVSEETHDQLSLLFDEAETIDWIEKSTEEIEVSVAPHTRKRKSKRQGILLKYKSLDCEIGILLISIQIFQIITKF